MLYFLAERRSVLTSLRKLPKCVVLIGAQGSGKGTLVEYFKKEGFVPAIMSDIFREWAMSRPEEAKRYGDIIAIIDSGTPLPDGAAKRAFEWKVKSIPVGKDVVLDGCVRTPVQAHDVVGLLMFEYHFIFILIECSRETSLDRIKMRIEERLRFRLPVREDDKDPKKVEKRLEFFEKNLPGIQDSVNYYGFPLFVIDGEQSKENVVLQAKLICSGKK